MTDRDPSRSRLPLAPIAALFLVALTLRPQLAAIGPLADPIIEGLGVSHAFVGLLTTIPVLCMGIFALVGPAVAHVLGVRRGVTASVAVLVAFAILRGVIPGAAALLLLTFGVGLGTGVVGPILPMFVRGRVPAAAVAGTSAYAAGIIVGAALGSAAAVPLAALAGGWQGALLLISLASVGALVAWWGLVRRLPAGGPAGVDVPPDAGIPRLPLRRPVVWAIGVLFALQSWLYYGTTAWIANVYQERGWDRGGAAGLLVLVSVSSLVVIGVLPWLSSKGLSRRALLVAGTVLAAVGLAGIAGVGEPAVLWTTVTGFGLGVTFTLVLQLPVDVSDDQREVGGAAAMMLVVGYLLSSVAPFVLGAVRDATGDFAVSLWLLAGLAALMVPLGWSLSPHRLRPATREAVAADEAA